MTPLALGASTLSRSTWPIGFAVALAILGGGCRSAGEGERPADPVVTVELPVEAPVTEHLEMTGTIAASRTVNLVARVPGYLQSIGFKDGDLVREGQLLCVIEPKPYEDQVAASQAVLMRAQAELDRQEAMLRENATARTTLENWRSQRDQAKAQLEQAKNNLGYTQVTAPFTGRIGARQVDEGNLVGASGPTVLATLTRLQPCYVNFNLNERDALRVLNLMREHGVAPKSGVGRARVELGLQNETGHPRVGVLNFADNSVSVSTGTIALRAVFANEDATLFPGLFARVRIPLGPPRPLLVIPETAIGSDQQGDFVYVVGPGDVVARRSIVPGPLTAGGRAVRSGLTATDRVVVNGLLNARPGQKVAPAPASQP
jgi:RND family efflux transporter MFP subunit